MAPLKLICPGLSRTGTLSMKTALDMLGYNTIHFSSFHQDHSISLDGFRDAITNREEADWDKLYENYDACIDIPTWIWYKDLLKQYPDAKVILTIRSAESWYTSFKKIVEIVRESNTRPDLERSVEAKKLLRELILAHDSPMLGKPDDKEAAIAAYLKHNQEVIDLVPKERLLVMELGDGWGKLCGFLDKPIPDVPYPKLNSPEEFQADFDERHEKQLEILRISEAQ